MISGFGGIFGGLFGTVATPSGIQQQQQAADAAWQNQIGGLGSQMQAMQGVRQTPYNNSQYYGGQLGQLGQFGHAVPMRPINPATGNVAAPAAPLKTYQDVELAEWTRKHEEAKAAADKGVGELRAAFDIDAALAET